jgi:hypothetical protein
MKKIINIFKLIWAWIKNLFKSRETPIVDTKQTQPLEEWTNPVIPSHNNRGKNVQYVDLGNGRTRAIYHNAI